MLTVLFFWITLFTIFLSFGEVAVSLWNTATKRDDSYSITDKFWIGICFLGTLLLYTSILAPLNTWVLGLIILITLFIIGAKRNIFKEYIKIGYQKTKKTPPIYKAITFFCLITILIYALSAPLIYDQGLYHLQSMQWTEQYPAMIGLGNLHGRLGFNSSFLLLSTLFNYHPESYTPAFTINSLCLLVFSIWLIKELKATKSCGKISAILLLISLSIFSLGASASSSSTDILPSILVMYLLFRWLFSEETKFATSHSFLIAIISIFSVTLKLSSAILLIALMVSLVYLFIQKDKRSILFLILIGVLIALPWLTRFIILTGYLVYPFPAIDLFSFDWKIPIEMVNEEKDAAYAWARIPDMAISEVLAMNIAEWVPLWAKRISIYALSLYSLALLSPLFIIVIWKAIEKKTYVLIWSVAYLGTIFTFFTAPDMRFAFGFLLTAIAIPFIIIVDYISRKTRVNHAILTTLAQITIMATIAFLGKVAYNQVSFHNKDAASLMISPLPIDAKTKKEDIKYQTYIFDKTSIFVPIGTNECINHPIPCMPYYNSNLEMRGGNIKDGFRIKH